MGRKKTNLEDRLLDTASTLFYTKGYPNTGIVEIIETANTNKTSFYHYYHSKNELAHKYLHRFNRTLLKTVIQLMRKSKNPTEFCKRWFKLIKNNIIKDNSFNGCPLANYYTQLEPAMINDKIFINRLGKRWLFVLKTYFRKEQENGKIPSSKSPDELSKIFFTTYQGSLITWKLLNDISVLDNALYLITSSFKE